MSLLAVAVSYRNAPLEELERASVSHDALAEALPCLLRAPDVGEALVLSTCNRTEVYAWVNDPEPAADQIRLFLEDLKDLPSGWAKSRCRVLAGEDVIRHLFAVTAGLDSMVQGESEIQGQVRAAYKTAVALGAVGPHLHGLFRWALEAGKRARAATGLSRAKESFPRAAVRAIDANLRGIAGREVLVVGSGRMAVAALRALSASGARTGVAARRLEAAEGLANQFDSFVLPLSGLEDALTKADGAIFATSSQDSLIGTEEVRRVLAARNGDPFVVVDLGLPRNVHPSAAELDGGTNGFFLFDLGRLDEEGFTVPGGHEAQLGHATDITLTEAERCVAWFRSKPADTVVAAIQAQAARVAETEAAQAARRIAGLDEKQQAAVEQAIRRSVRKVIHVPTVRAKEACSRGDTGLLEAARWLFGLDGEPEVPAPRGEGAR